MLCNNLMLFIEILGVTSDDFELLISRLFLLCTSVIILRT